MPLTPRQLLDNTPGVVKSRTNVCSVRLVRAGKHIIDPKFGKCFQLLYNLRCLDGDRFVTVKYIGALKPGIGQKREQDLAIPGQDSQVWVSCTCPFHLFNTEYALTHHESSDILYSNGKPANIRNPRNVGFVCKHVVLALEKSFSEAANATPEGEMTKKKVDEEESKIPQTKPVKEPEAPKVEPKKEVLKPKEDPKSWKQKLTDWISDPKETTKPKPPTKEKPLPPKEDPKSWKQKLNDWLYKDKKEEPLPPKGKSPVSWRDRLTNWMKK